MNGAKVARGGVALLWVVAALCLFALIDRGFTVYEQWLRYQAQAGVAQIMLEEPIVAYDPVLGWKHVPGRRVDMEQAFPGENIVFEINQNGFRGVRDYSRERPDGVRRVIALGDSFTFGNNRTHMTWPAQLETSLGAAGQMVEVINMGASGYGVDQMALWYREDGYAFEADLVICAIIANDLERAHLHKWASGHGRPKFELVDRKLKLTNVPVPDRIAPGAPNRHEGDLADFVRRLAAAERSDRSVDFKMPMAVLDHLRNMVEERGARFHLVYLPTQPELDGTSPMAELTSQHAQRLDLPFFDTSDAIKQAMGRSRVPLYRLDGHFTDTGNSIVAKALLPMVLAGFGVNSQAQ
ncbi:MAG: lysophospholipase L1-like esterase [Myxococcota bacterium]|jgi:lysophospholipase L1-like esterase